MISSANSMKLGYLSEVGIRVFLQLFSILGYILQSDWYLVFRILNYRSSLVMFSIIMVLLHLLYSGLFSKWYYACCTAGILLLSGVIKSVLFGIVRRFIQQEIQKISIFQLLFNRLESLTCSVWRLHILIGIIPVHIPFVFILPLIKIARTQFL